MKLSKLVEQLPTVIVDVADYNRKLGLDLQVLSIDYCKLQARTKEEYQEWKDEVSNLAHIIESSESLGAETLAIELTMPIKSALGELKLVYLAEPAENRIYDKYGIALIGIVVPDVHQYKETVTARGVKASDVQKQSDAELMDYELNDITITVRSQPLYTEVIKRNTPVTSEEKVVHLHDEISKLKETIAELEKEKLAKFQIMADFQNYRKRVEKEKSSFGLLANMEIVNDVLDVLDDLKRTIEDDEKDLPRAQQMLEIARDKLMATVGKVGLDMIDVHEGDLFDASIMEALGTVSVSSVDDHNKVITVVQPAYKYRDKDQLLRTAKVIVGKKDTRKEKNN